MVIQNSEVQMTSKSNFSVTTKASYQVSQAPAIKIGDITFKLPDSEKESGTEEVKDIQAVDEATGVSLPANRQVRMQAMTYLIRALLLSKIFGEDKSFSDFLQDFFGENSGTMTTTSVSYERTESQSVSFSSKGTAVTADGRRLSFDYGFEMSESFSETFESISSAFTRFIDPLVINLKDSPASIANQTFLFDLDGDGNKDEINQLSVGQGFLALDKNEDGEINDGTELFGAKTGDGFSELAVFDEDCNGWIDENDPIFEKLRVWSMNEKGDMELYTLKQSDVGAIFLGRVGTEYVNHDDENKARAAIRQSGIYLHESDGHAGGIQHVDFAT
ncbi:hypothetical protein SAMN04487830_106108 [Pseudobutyrivibrio sp. OR37]|uniref:hypothetical protein n=1 Tax=Pseudobutyrivibrio sp. OR37 TaxID=1798186 RepID=UPI0008E10453|nr:hypothetical protein [Pseudobutyrivibrio sp. OR37]SFH72738.1 hypothetical protein SAMN04487830_106108 [Pseudobutyrivibrio sp. OR37]